MSWTKLEGLKIECESQQKYQKKSYQLRQNLVLFCNLVALILD